MDKLKHTLSQDILCSLIAHDSENHNDKIKLLVENRYQEILDIAIENMSPDQRIFYDKIYKKDDNTEQYYFLAGLPGTGKSYLQNVLHLSLALDTRDFICVAPTNFIAFQQHGFTIHSSLIPLCETLGISKFKIEEDLISKLISHNHNITKTKLQNMNLENLKSIILDYYFKNSSLSFDEKLKCFESSLVENSFKIKMVLIDEGSMVSSLLFALLSLQFPKSKFIVMYGPNQLPPINGFPSCDELFDSSSPPQVFYHNLETQMRFNKDCHEFTNFIAFFNNVLSGKVTAKEKLSKMQYFYKHLHIGGTLKDYKLLTRDRILIVSTNKQRCHENEMRLLNEKSDGKIYEIPAIFDE